MAPSAVGALLSGSAQKRTVTAMNGQGHTLGTALPDGPLSDYGVEPGDSVVLLPCGRSMFRLFLEPRTNEEVNMVRLVRDGSVRKVQEMNGRGDVAGVSLPACGVSQGDEIVLTSEGSEFRIHLPPEDEPVEGAHASD